MLRNYCWEGDLKNMVFWECVLTLFSPQFSFWSEVNNQRPNSQCLEGTRKVRSTVPSSLGRAGDLVSFTSGPDETASGHWVSRHSPCGLGWGLRILWLLKKQGDELGPKDPLGRIPVQKPWKGRPQSTQPEAEGTDCWKTVWPGDSEACTEMPKNLLSCWYKPYTSVSIYIPHKVLFQSITCLLPLSAFLGFPGRSVVNDLPVNAGDDLWVGMCVWSLGQEDSLKQEMAIDFCILAYKIPWTEESGRLQSTGSQRVGHNWAHDWAWLAKPRFNSPKQTACLRFPFRFLSFILCLEMSSSPPQM